jgi:hypothetical protein
MFMEGEHMPMVWLAALILGSGFAIAGGQGWGWKLLNAVIILGCIGLGLGLGYAAGLGTQNFGRVPNAAVPFGMIFGIVGAIGCMAGNRSR